LGILELGSLVIATLSGIAQLAGVDLGDKLAWMFAGGSLLMGP